MLVKNGGERSERSAAHHAATQSTAGVLVETSEEPEKGAVRLANVQLTSV